MKIKWEFESELALKAASTGGELIYDRPERLSTSIKDSFKELVTDLDVRIEKQISEILKVSEFPIVGEETSARALESLSDTSTYWLVDPIDGTTNFVSGMPFYAVSVGLRAKGEFVAGAVFLPAFRELFFTYGDQGSFLNGKALGLSTPDSLLKEALIAASFSNSPENFERKQKQYELFGIINEASRGCLRLGSAAANLCYVASGKLQAAYGLAAHPWDIAGGIAIAKQAKCRVVTYKIPHSTRVHYVAGTPRIVNELKDIFQSQGVANWIEV